MKSHLRIGVSLFVLLTLLTGAIYPLFVTVVAQALFPYQANGSIVRRDGQPIGSALIGQFFDDPRYFWGRPSATEEVPYNAASSTGSNLGPSNSELLGAVRGRVQAIREAHPNEKGAVPVELVSASASGLDPHISPAAAEYQVARVARARGLRPERVRQLVTAHSEGRTFGVLGEPRVHVLRLNLALDEEGK